MSDVKVKSKDEARMQMKAIIGACEEMVNETKAIIDTMSGLEDDISEGLAKFIPQLAAIRPELVTIQESMLAAQKNFNQFMETLEKMDEVGNCSLD